MPTDPPESDHILPKTPDSRPEVDHYVKTSGHMEILHFLPVQLQSSMSFDALFDVHINCPS